LESRPNLATYVLLAAKMAEIDISKDGESNTCEGRRGIEGLEGGTASAGNDWSLGLSITISVTGATS
jgi:hypothetical protein